LFYSLALCSVGVLDQAQPDSEILAITGGFADALRVPWQDARRTHDVEV